MPEASRPDVVVIGAGIIGSAIAVRLQLAGHRTLLIDECAPGGGCSFGNAGILATSFVLPLSNPRHLLRVPALLLDSNGPLAIRPADLPTTLPWLARFLRNAAPARQAATTDALKQLNGGALASWRNLLRLVRAPSILVERGMIEVARTPRAMASVRAFAARARAANVRLTDLSREDVVALEPRLKGSVTGGVLHEDVAHVPDPVELVRLLCARFAEAGGQFEHARVQSVEAIADGVLVAHNSGLITASKVIVANGEDGGRLMRQLGATAPIGVERGYHLMLPSSLPEIGRPIAFHSEAFVATPMSSGTRLAGTVELARSDAPPAWERADRLLTLARHYLPDLSGRGAVRWIGSRPSFPDSLPAIGRLRAIPQILYAFGHQHLGLTQAATTADYVLSMIADPAPAVSLRPFSLERFGRAEAPKKRCPS